jgi:transposase
MRCIAQSCPSKPYKKNAALCDAFPQRLGEELTALRQQLKQRSESKPIQLWTMDESRFGLKTLRRRRLTLKGCKPVMPIQDQFENTYLFGAFAPSSGSAVYWELPFLNAETFEAFLREFAADEQTQATYNVLLVDNAPAHHAKTITIPSNVALIFLPPYSPERSPAERVWEYIKDHLAGRIFDSLDALSLGIEQVIKSTPQNVIASLTSPDWLMEIINAQLSI